MHEEPRDISREGYEVLMPLVAIDESKIPVKRQTTYAFVRDRNTSFFQIDGTD